MNVGRSGRSRKSVVNHQSACRNAPSDESHGKLMQVIHDDSALILYHRGYGLPNRSAYARNAHLVEVLQEVDPVDSA